jgi:hypothetical protein
MAASVIAAISRLWRFVKFGHLGVPHAICSAGSSARRKRRHRQEKWPSHKPNDSAGGRS